MQTLYLVDGSGYIFRAFFAIQPLASSKGLPTNALLGFTRMLVKLLRDADAHYMAVAFDTKEPTFRHELYSEYKANREECPETLVPQLPYFRKIVEALGIRALEKPGVEADDIIATIATRLGKDGQKIVIVSGDKDLTQLVNGDIEMWDAMRDIRFDPAQVREKFGVAPAQIADYLALTGDSSDNVPGAKGIGPKTAQRLLEHFGSLEALYANPQEIEQLSGLRGAKGIREKIESNKELVRLSRQLVTLDDKVAPFNSVSVVEEYQWEHAQPDLLRPLLEELEFTSMPGLHDIPGTEALTAKIASGIGTAEKSIAIVTSETLQEFAHKLSEVKEFAFDVETTSLDVLSCELVGISFSWQDRSAYYLPLSVTLSGRSASLDAVKVRELLNPVFSDPAKRKIGVNLKFDIQVLEQHGYTVRGTLFDAMLCSYVLNPDRREHGLKALARIHFNEQMLTFDEVVGEFEHIGLVPLEQVAKYACDDAEVSYRLMGKLNPLLGARDPAGGPSQRRVFEDIEAPLVYILAAMELTGVAVDVPFLARLGSEFGGELETLQGRIYELAGTEFNINSPKQLGGILFDKLGISTAGVKKKKSGLSTDASVLEKLAPQHEIVALLLEYRELHKLMTTYVEALQRMVNPKTGRIHASFNQAVAATGRLSSSDPNLQNIPIRNPRGRRLRHAFIAAPGSVLLSADYSQIELRILAALSGDSALRSAFLSGEDIHLRTAKEIFGGLIADEKALKDLRRVAKTINFGLIYGMGAFRLSQELHVSRSQAQQYIDSYFARYPKVLEYFTRLKENAETLGYVSTFFGRRRYVQDLDTSGRDSGYAGRSMMNAPVQGTAAEVIKITMINLQRRLADFNGSAKMILQVHDELVFEVEERLVQEVQELVVSEMESAVDLGLPLKVDVRVNKSWGEVS